MNIGSGLTQQDIERIVQTVVARLNGLPSQPPSRPPAAPASYAPAGPPADSLGGPAASPLSAVYLDCRLITLSSLPALQGVDVLQVAPRAIVTPAVIDFLRDRKVKLERKAAPVRPNDARSSGANSPDLLAGVHLTRLTSMLVMTDAGQTFPSCPAQVLSGSHNTSADARRVVAHLSGGGAGAVWYTARPYAVAAAAASNGRLAFVQLPSLAELNRALRESTPRVLIVDRQIWKPPQLLELLHAWCDHLDRPQAS